jgi:hypothetical protein
MPGNTLRLLHAFPRCDDGSAGTKEVQVKACTFRTLPFLTFLLLAGLQPASTPVRGEEPTSNYLPLATGAKWVLRSPQAGTAVFEVVQNDGEGFRLRSTNPWGSSEWTLVGRDGKFSMTAYGTGGRMMPLPQKPLYLDFTSRAGTTWSNALGALTVVSRSAVVRAGGQKYSDCIQIRHKAKGGGAGLVFTFARGIGYVQFGEGDSAFVLSVSESALPWIGSGRTGPVASQPAELPRRTPPSVPGSRAVLIGLTPNRFANEPLTMEVMMNHFNQTLDAGVTYVAAYGDWAKLEPQVGQYSLGDLNLPLSIAANAGLPASFALRVINTVARDVPPDLRHTSWADPKMRSRVLRLMDAIAPILKGRARWFTFGYEIDGYLAKHPDEVQGFTELHRLAAARIKELVPGIEVSCILTYSGIGDLQGRLSRLNQQLDFLAVTYTPANPDLTVKDPSVLPSDFARIKEIANGRRIVMQEIAYPTSLATGGSEDKQAECFRLAFQEIQRDPAAFEAANFMMFADLSDADTDHFQEFYGLKTPAFRGLLQTIGMFDVQGQPKKGWQVFRSYARSLRAPNATQ